MDEQDIDPTPTQPVESDDDVDVYEGDQTDDGHALKLNYLERSYSPTEDDFESTIDECISPRTAPGPVYIDDLADVVVNGEWTAREGQYIVVEKWNTFNMNKPRWMGTSVYLIRRIDPITGDVQLFDEDLQQSCMSNTTRGPRIGWRFKFHKPGVNLREREKRPEVVKDRVEREREPKAPRIRKDGQPHKDRVVRPKHVIEADKKQKAEARRLKQEAKAAKKNEQRARIDAEREAKRAAKAPVKPTTVWVRKGTV